jgi:hypothetical protein
MALALSSASARNFSVNEQGFSIRWASLTFGYHVADVRCPVTLRGSFHSRTMVKTTGLLIGAITGATGNTAACTGGRITLLVETLPWHLRYTSFTGTLPRISSINLGIAGRAIQLEAEGIFCLFTTEAGEPYEMNVVIGSSGEARTAAADTDTGISLEDEDFLCSFIGNMVLAGTGAIDGNVVEPVVFRLIT